MFAVQIFLISSLVFKLGFLEFGTRVLTECPKKRSLLDLLPSMHMLEFIAKHISINFSSFNLSQDFLSTFLGFELPTQLNYLKPSYRLN